MVTLDDERMYRISTGLLGTTFKHKTIFNVCGSLKTTAIGKDIYF